MMTYKKQIKQFLTLSFWMVLVVTAAGLSACGQKIPVEPKGKTTQDSRQY